MPEAGALVRLRFGVFEVDLRAGELRKHGVRLRIQEQPFQVLAMLLERPGQTVTREELRNRLWTAETFVDFDHGVNKAVNRIRDLLSDSATSPRFVETVPRRGYRFIAEVAVVEGAQIARPEARTGDPVPVEDAAVAPVSARPSPERLRRSYPLSQIARELNVDAVIEGTVLRSGGQVRITAQLIEARGDTHVWSETYDGDLRDTLTLQNNVAQAIAEHIRVNLNPQEQATLKQAKVVDPQAYEAYLKGRYFWNKRTGDDLQKAVEYFRLAIERDPNYAQAYSGLADTYALLGDWEYGVLAPREALPQAKAAAVKALQLDNTLGEAHTSLRSVWMSSSGTWHLPTGNSGEPSS